MPESNIMLGLDVKIGSMQEDQFCKMGWLVNNLTITRSQCNGIKLLSNIVTSIERILI